MDEAPRIHLQWHWVIENDTSKPSCSVFCCPIPEQRLLNEMIFRQEDIINYINREIVDISSPETRIRNLEEFYRRSAGFGMNCSLHQYTLMNDISKHVDLQYAEEDADKVYFICVYGERSFVSKVIAVSPLESGITYTMKQQKGLLNRFFKKNSLSIEFDNISSRRLVLVSKVNGEEIYSVVPSGEKKFYFSADIQEEDICSARYLSSLIGK